MQVVSSYGAEIKNKNIPIRHTLALYREAVRCLTEIYETVWTELSMIDQIKRRFNEAEHLVHETKKNHARFDFDARFPKMPSYLRRAAIQHALGSVSSYHTRLEQWKNGAISGKPKLVYENHAMPVFYRDVMYKPGEESEDAACLKLYDGHDWKWFCEELGDVLFQVMFHSEIEAECGNFTVDDVVNGICEKMIRRHPRIFGGEIPEVEDEKDLWEAIKKQEREMKKKTGKH